MSTDIIKQQILTLENGNHNCNFFTTPCNMCKKMTCFVHCIESKRDLYSILRFCNKECEDRFFELKKPVNCNKKCQNINDAILRKCLNCVKIYSMNASKEDINKSLVTSSECGNLDIVKYLVLEHSADVNFMDRGYTPLSLAAGSGHVSVVRFLIDNEANVNAKTTDGDTALIFACMDEDGDGKNENSDFFECQKVLLANGADPNLQDDCGNTALHFILGWGQDKKHKGECSKLLLKYGADPTIKNNKGQTPAEYALKMY